MADEKDAIESSQTDAAKPTLKNWCKLTLIGIVVLAVLAIGFCGYRRWNKPAPTQQQIDAAQNSGNYKKAIALTQEAIAKTKSPAQKSTLYVELADDELNHSNTNQGLQAFKSAALVNGMTANIAYTLAYTYMNAGNKPQAIKYFQQAISLWSKSDPLYKTQVTSMQQLIKSLQGDSGTK